MRRDQIFLPCLKKILRWTRNQNRKGRIVIGRGRRNERTRKLTQAARGVSTHTLAIIKLNCPNRLLRLHLHRIPFLLLSSPIEGLVRPPYPLSLPIVPSRPSPIIHSQVLPYGQHHLFLRPHRHQNYPYPIPAEVVYPFLDPSQTWQRGTRRTTPCISLIRSRLSRKRTQGRKGTTVQCAARVSALHTGYRERDLISFQSVGTRYTR